MTIRTIEELFDGLSSDLAWRRKELSETKAILDSAIGRRVDALIRSAVPLLYAHWEGFVKYAASAYLEFVAARRLRLDELAANFVALSLRPRLLEAARRDDAGLQTEIVTVLIGGRSARSALAFRDGVDTKSNLSFAVLTNIMNSLGLSPDLFATKQKLIDERLLFRRNNIAHGKYLAISAAEYDELHHQVLEMLETFRNLIDNAASASLYRAA